MALITDENRAKITPCKCVEIEKGKQLCWSDGAIGFLSNKQESDYCPIKLYEQSDKMLNHIHRFTEHSKSCSLVVDKELPKGERESAFLNCMKKLEDDDKQPNS